MNKWCKKVTKEVDFLRALKVILKTISEHDITQTRS
jgi:hypothetical protein